MTFSSTIIGLKLLPDHGAAPPAPGGTHDQHPAASGPSGRRLHPAPGGCRRSGHVWTRMALSGLALPGPGGAGLGRRALCPVAHDGALRHHSGVRLPDRHRVVPGAGAALQLLGLSAEVGAFIAGVALASSPIAQYLAESLRPLRDFFLVLFFFALGAQFNLAWPRSRPGPCGHGCWESPWSSNPGSFAACWKAPESPRVARGRSASASASCASSPSSLPHSGLQAGVFSERAALTLQFATLLTFLVSSYLVVLRFPTPIAISDALRRD